MTFPSPLDDHLQAPRGRGRLKDAPHQGAAGGAACGDLVRIAVRLGAGGVVAESGFDASGCGAAQAAASAAVELVEGAPLLDAARVGPDEIAEALGGLVPAKRHAAALAADALHRALGAAAADAAPPAGGPVARRTLVAMSGGVDSAVAAQLLQERGDEVVGVTLELWADPANDGERSCCSAQAVTGARALAHRMGLPHLTLDLREPFRRAVVDDFVAEHAAGRTPNPCTRCNGLVRFDRMLALADRLGAAQLATGHYARVEGEAEDGAGPLLRAAADARKDQAYMLARVAPATLGRVVFPLAELTKPEVREIARRAGLAVADKPESQDLCFLAGTGREPFLARHGAGLPVAKRSAGGEIVDASGRVLARHDGQQRFTVGQRRGLGIAAGEPLFVVHKDAASGRVTVGPRAALAAASVRVEDARLHRPGAEVDRVKLRYRSEPVGCRIEGDAGSGTHASLRLSLARQVDAVAPGQTACLMRGDVVVGYATISGP